jgi:hypothetical protein
MSKFEVSIVGTKATTSFSIVSDGYPDVWEWIANNKNLTQLPFIGAVLEVNVKLVD